MHRRRIIPQAVNTV